jgi:RimJ/RimL family protein N-acetyltransferase
MRYTIVGRVDKDLSETQTKINPFLPPHDVETYNYAICLAATGEVIGLGGMFKLSLHGWPELGYMIKREHWGRGYATEFLKGWLDDYWQLPRSAVEIEIDALTAGPAGEAKEQLSAIVESSNTASRRVLEKAGFQKVGEWKEPNSHEGHEQEEVTLIGFTISPN